MTQWCINYVYYHIYILCMTSYKQQKAKKKKEKKKKKKEKKKKEKKTGMGSVVALIITKVVQGFSLQCLRN